MHYTIGMEHQDGPGVIPDWRQYLSSLNIHERTRLALSVGYSVQSINNWAQGRSTPKPPTLKEIERIAKRKGKA